MESAARHVLKGATKPDWRDRLHGQTIVELLHVRSDSLRTLTLLDAHGNPTVQPWGQVVQDVFRYATLLKKRGIAPGDRVVLMLPTGSEFVHAFFGIIAAGAIPVPVYPPFNLKQLTSFIQTLVGVFNDSGASAIIFWKDVKAILGEALSKAPGIKHAISVESLAEAPAARADDLALDPTLTAMIQYTSGSTDAPKGVELSHLNLLHNVHHVVENLQVDPERDRCVSWLPLYHDMGLIGTLMGSLYSDIDLILMAPQSFLMRPRMWLGAITDYRATITTAPNFAYNLCATRISDKALEGLDLSSLRIAMCGAEPIRQDTYQAFRERFAPYGFREDAFLPVYGLAESTVGATFPSLQQAPQILWIDRETLEGQMRAEPAAKDEGIGAFALGMPFPESCAKVVDPDSGEALPEGRVGEIALSGPSVMKGYFQNPTKTAETIRDGWLHTGDLGFIHGGQLFVTGRKKDLIIRYGRNYYPQDLEATVETVEGVRKGCVITFGHLDHVRQSEEVVVLAETRLSESKDLEALSTRIKEALQSRIGFTPDRIELLPPHTLLKTSSGKLRRKPTQLLYLAGSLRPHQDSVMDQLKIMANSQLHWGKRKLDGLKGGQA